MLSDERIEELWVDIHKGKFMHAGFNTFARAIEAAVLPEGLVAVPKEPTLAMLDCLRSGITSNLEKRYQAMLAAAPMPAQAEKQEPNCGHESCDCRGYCEKQEPVKDEPVFEVGFGWLIAALEEAAREARERR